MKKIIVALLFMSIMITSFSQSAWKGFWKPVSSDKVFMSGLNVGVGFNEWKFRPTVSVLAQKFTLSGDDHVFTVGTLNAAGVGLSYQHFIDIDGAPYNNFGINAVLLVSTDFGEEIKVSPCPFIGLQALQFLNAGIGFDFGVKKVFFALGATYSFN